MKNGGRVPGEALVHGQVSEKLSVIESQVKLRGTATFTQFVHLGEDLTVISHHAGAARADALEQGVVVEPGIETEETAVGVAEEAMTAGGRALAVFDPRV